MKYLSVHNISHALHQVVTLNTQQSSDRLASEFTKHYFPVGRYTCSSISSEDSPLNTPVTLVTKLFQDGTAPHAFVSSQISGAETFSVTIDKIVNCTALRDFIENVGDENAIYIFLFSGTQLAIYEYFTHPDKFELASIETFKGLKPLNELILFENYKDINNYIDICPEKYLEYLVNKNALNFQLSTSVEHLRHIGVRSVPEIQTPHI